MKARIRPMLWSRYYFESDDRYYTIILQQDLFHEWSITRVYGGKYNRLGGFMVESCNTYEEALERISCIRKRREGRKYKIVGSKVMGGSCGSDKKVVVAIDKW
jgi:hypothetical protein